jgi:hypothetical protein
MVVAMGPKVMPAVCEIPKDAEKEVSRAMSDFIEQLEKMANIDEVYCIDGIHKINNMNINKGVYIFVLPKNLRLIFTVLYDDRIMFLDIYKKTGHGTSEQDFSDIKSLGGRG